MWLVRFNSEAPLHYWGFKQLGDADTRAFLSEARSVVFVDGAASWLQGSAVQDLLYWYPDIDLSKLVQVTHFPAVMLVRSVHTTC